MQGDEALLKVVVTGALGRMGRMFVTYLDEQPGCAIYGATERHDHPHIGRDLGQALFGRPLNVSVENDLKNAVIGANAVIDFTSPESSVRHAKVCADMGIPLVCGTTGMNETQLAEFRAFAEQTRCVFAPNFSQGITLLLALAERAARALGGEFDVEIVEAHHRYKVDAPSGTALALARAAGEALGLDEDGYVFGREGQVGARETSVIGIHAVRGGDVVGEHELHFLGDGEQVTLRHRATSREAFVRGAVRAAIWIQDKEPGIYSMRDVLGIGRA